MGLRPGVLFITPRKACSEWWLAYEPEVGHQWVYVHGPFTRKSDALRELRRIRRKQREATR
jgi:hypothetical protein